MRFSYKGVSSLFGLRFSPALPPSTRTSSIMFLRSALLSLSALAAAKEMPKDEIKAAELYDSGIRHANNVALKKV